MMTTASLVLATIAALLAQPNTAEAAIPGGGASATDCFAEFSAPHMRLNHPYPDPTRRGSPREVRCFDGDAACDLDGETDGSCLFDVDVCVHVADPELPSCTPQTVTAARVTNPGRKPSLDALASAIDALLPASSTACTTGQRLEVPLRGPSARGVVRRGTGQVRLKAWAGGRIDSDRVRLTCVPREWPTHGYDHRNRRSSTVPMTLGPATAASLQPKWTVDLRALNGGNLNGVTSTPTVADGRVYATSWNGKVYAIDARTGAVLWQYDTGAGSFLGVQSSATLTAEGRLFVGDSLGRVHGLDARDGRVLWVAALGDTAVDHFWSSPTVAGGRVFAGIASHSDQPCTRGRLVALDVDTGEVLWTRFMVPEKVCNNDTSLVCTGDADCGGNPCVTARGAGVTATVAVEPSGDSVYVNTVGCYTFPSVGDSDSIMRLDARTGATIWLNRVQPIEQFRACSNDGSIDCTSSAQCPLGGSCNLKGAYHDFGFLNGPLLVDADDGAGGTRTLVASGSKDGTLYALDPATGGVVWQRAVLPTPVTPGFAGYGLFNGAMGFADDRFFGTLYEFVPATVPAPQHLMALSAIDGSTAWTAPIGRSWSSIGLAGGLVFAGTQASKNFYVHDAATGTQLKSFALPANVASGASVVGDTVYVGYGVFGADGGVAAFSLP